MNTGHWHRISAVRWTLSILLLALPVFLLGCGGDEEPEGTDQTTTEAMVPAVGDSVLESGLETLESAVSAARHTVDPDASVVEDEVLAPPATEPATKVVSSPIKRAAERTVAGDISLQLGSFRSAENAAAQAQRIRELGYAPTVEVATLGGETYHRVVLDGLADRAAAKRLGEEIRSRLGITYLIRQK